MAKGKKFNAAEKHFIEKELLLKKEIKEKDDKIRNLEIRVTELVLSRDEAYAEMVELNKKIEKLLELSGMKEEELKTLLEKDKTKANVLHSVSIFSQCL